MYLSVFWAFWPHTPPENNLFPGKLQTRFHTETERGKREHREEKEQSTKQAVCARVLAVCLVLYLCLYIYKYIYKAPRGRWNVVSQHKRFKVPTATLSYRQGAGAGVGNCDSCRDVLGRGVWWPLVPPGVRRILELGAAGSRSAPRHPDSSGAPTALGRPLLRCSGYTGAGTAPKPLLLIRTFT